MKENANIKDDPGEAYLESLVGTVKTEGENINTKQNKNQPNVDEFKKHHDDCRKKDVK